MRAMTQELSNWQQEISITENEENVPLINSIGEENVHASIGHMAELM